MSRFLKDEPRAAPPPSQVEIRRAQDFWTDVFHDAIMQQIDSIDTKGRPSDIVRFAGEVADEALRAKEERWGKL